MDEGTASGDEPKTKMGRRGRPRAFATDNPEQEAGTADAGGGADTSGGGASGAGARPQGNAEGDEDDDARPAPPTQAFGSSAAPPLTAEGSGRAPGGASSGGGATDGEGKKFTGVSRRKQEQAARSDETSKRNAKYEDASREIANLDIPEMEDEGKEDLSAVVAAAPKVVATRVQRMDELEQDMQIRLPPSEDDRDIDLSLLTAVLCASEQVEEPDDVWHPDVLLTEVASELNQEKEKGMEPEDGGPPLELTAL